MTEHPAEPMQQPVDGVVAVIPRGGQLLVIRRSAHVRAPGAFCFPGGGVLPGEDEPVALVRELVEELNITIVPKRRLWASTTAWNISLAWWLAELPSNYDIRPDPLEVEAVHWLTLDEIRRLPGLLSSNLEFLDAHRRGEICW